jgi:hypothetical protein
MIENKNTAFEIFRAMAVSMVLVGHFAALSIIVYLDLNQDINKL